MESRIVRMLGIACVALFFAACGGDGEDGDAPRIGGKTRSAWEALVESGSAAEQVEALRALARFPSPPLPLFEARLEDPEPEVRAAAILCLGAVGPEAAHRAPDLAIYLEEDPPEIKDPKARRAIRNAAINALGQMGPEAFPAIAHLLASREVSHRRNAVFAIRPFVAELEDGTKVLLPLVEDKDWFVRREAARGLGLAGKGDERAQEALLTALEDSDARVVSAAALSMGGIGGRSDREGQALADLLVRHEGAVRAAAVYGLGEMRDEAAPYADDVLDLLKNDARRAVRIQAALAHYRITGDPSAALPELEKSVPCEDPGLCRDALRALKGLGPEAASTAASVAVLLKKPRLRAAAAEALASMGRAAKDTLPALQAAATEVGDADPEGAKAIAEAIEAISAEG